MSTDPSPASLGTLPEDVTQYTGLQRIGERFARALADMLQNVGVERAAVRFSGTESHDIQSWLQSHTAPAVTASYQIKPFKGKMAITLPARMIVQAVDLFYGGDGQVDTNQREYSAAEERFIARLTEGCGQMLQPCWGEYAPVEGVLLATDSCVTKLSAGRSTEQLFVQRFSVSGTSLDECHIECVYQASALRHVEALRSQTDDEPMASADPVWRDRLHQSVAQVCLPVQSVLARPELPLSRIMSLRPGDIIPFAMPRSVPLTVAGKLFAHGTIGESDGRVAIKIETIQ